MHGHLCHRFRACCCGPGWPEEARTLVESTGGGRVKSEQSMFRRTVRAPVSAPATEVRTYLWKLGHTEEEEEIKKEGRGQVLVAVSKDELAGRRAAPYMSGPKQQQHPKSHLKAKGDRELHQ